ncbi:MAG TPA: 16S rRNA (cytidine(1402)-2'-O)-methyltransferase [Candidatus Limnocylindrales bacterium]|nr:16S rRNA (cytidine(1402)-2'-O)-methyltransferase [Candidatus Limnocylindrales bacterium]
MAENLPSVVAGGTLYVVATPIGNLGDITLRAIEVLRAVPLVVAEDTRLTRRLWARHGIVTRLASFHAHSSPGRLEQLLAHLAGGADLALVTDAGTPLVSDPGAELVAAWAARGGQVVPIPGASAALAALVASGLPAARWAFEGFLARRGRERRQRIERICADERTTIVFEAPGRAAATLADLAAACGDDRPAALCRELTKLHEETWRGSLGELARRAAETPPRGEITIVVAGAARSNAASIGLVEGLAQVEALVEQGWSRSSAARDVAGRTGLPRRDLFRGDFRGGETSR